MSRNKHAEVASFRSKLGATLQHLVDKKDESQPSSEGEGSSSQPEVQVRLPSPVSSPRKSAGRARKRKRKDDDEGADGDSLHYNYIMKLFDRSVDLAQFEEDTPLYPVCRAWIKNQPNNRNLGPQQRTQTPEPDQDQMSQDDEESFPAIYSLPAPVKQEVTENYRDPRIPSPVHLEEPSLDIHADPDQAPPPEHLLLNHMAKWKVIREKWRKQAFRNELRYNDGLTILKDMFERQCKEG